MLTLVEIISSCVGAGRLFLFDHRGYQAFNFSREGFWRSFVVAALLAPVYLALVIAQHRLALALSSPEQLAHMPTLTRTLAVEAAIYPLYWATFPLLMLWIVRLLDVAGRYTPYIIVYNWSTVVTVTIQAIPYGLFVLGVLPSSLMQPCVFASVVIALVYRWSITHTVLSVGTLAAVGVVFSDLLLTLAIALTAQAVLL